MTTSAPGGARPLHRPGTAPLRAVAAGLATVLVGLLGACSSDGAQEPSEVVAAEVTSSPTRPAPSPTPSASPTTTPSATPSPTPTAAAPAPAPAPAPGTDTGTASGIALRSGGRIGDFPVEAPEAEVVAYLTDVLGSEPVVEDPESACGYDVGRRIRWGALVVFVRSVDALGEPVTPYVAAWAVQEPSSDLATVEGLRVGDPVDRIAALYPGVVSGEDEHDPTTLWWNAQTPDGQGYAFLSQNGTVYRLSSGAVCGE